MIDSTQDSPRKKGPRILRHPWLSGEAATEEAVLREFLEQGRVMTYPTETSYALGGNALAPDLVESIYRLKGRPAGKALPLLIDGSNGVEPWARDGGPAARRLMERHWPGPLTLVLHAGPGLPPRLADARGTVALRWSSHPLIAEMIRIAGAPLIGTSANRSGEPNCHTLEDVLRAIPAGIALAVDGGHRDGRRDGRSGGRGGALSPGESGNPADLRDHRNPRDPRGFSTLLDTTVTPFRVLRKGAISLPEFE